MTWTLTAGRDDTVKHGSDLYGNTVGCGRCHAPLCRVLRYCTVQEIYCLSTGQRCAAATSPTVSTLTVCSEEPYLLPDLNLNPLCYSSRYRRPVEESHIGYRSTQEHEGGRGDGRFSVFYAKCRCFSKLPNLTCFIKLASYRPLKAISFLVYRGSLDDCDLKRCFHYDQSIRFIQTDIDFPLATTLQHRTLFRVRLGKFICFNENNYTSKSLQ